MMSTYHPRDNLLHASRGFTVFSSGSQVSMTTWSRFCTKNRDITEFISVFIWCWLISVLMPVALQASCQINLVLQVEEVPWHISNIFYNYVKFPAWKMLEKQRRLSLINWNLTATSSEYANCILSLDCNCCLFVKDEGKNKT